MLTGIALGVELVQVWQIGVLRCLAKHHGLMVAFSERLTKEAEVPAGSGGEGHYSSFASGRTLIEPLLITAWADGPAKSGR